LHLAAFWTRHSLVKEGLDLCLVCLAQTFGSNCYSIPLKHQSCPRPRWPSLGHRGDIRFCTPFLWRRHLHNQLRGFYYWKEQLTNLFLPVPCVVDGDMLVCHSEILECFERDRSSTVMLLPLISSAIVRSRFPSAPVVRVGDSRCVIKDVGFHGGCIDVVCQSRKACSLSSATNVFCTNDAMTYVTHALPIQCRPKVISYRQTAPPGMAAFIESRRADCRRAT
jgi:hypothetical protein